MGKLWAYLQSYTDLIGQLAISFTVIYYSMGLLVCYDMYKEGHTRGYSTTPFIVGFTIAALSLKYALLVEDAISITICTISLVIHAVCITFYTIYSQDRWRKIGQPLLYATTFICLLYTYAEIENEEKVVYRFGLAITITLLAIMASPLRNLRLIVANQDSSYLPCMSVTISLITTTLIIIYSIAASDRFLLAQNLCRAIIASMQVFLCLKYPRRNRQINFSTGNNNEAVANAAH